MGVGKTGIGEMVQTCRGLLGDKNRANVKQCNRETRFQESVSICIVLELLKMFVHEIMNNSISSSADLKRLLTSAPDHSQPKLRHR